MHLDGRCKKLNFFLSFKPGRKVLDESVEMSRLRNYPTAK